MAFSRKAISDFAKENNMESVPKEFIDSIIGLHVETRDSKIEEERTKAIEQYKAENPAQEPVQADIKKSDEYKALLGEFDQYKANVEGEKLNASKSELVKAELLRSGVNEKALGLILNTVDLSKVELDGETLKGADELVTGLKSSYGDFFGTQTQQTTNTGNTGQQAPPDSDPFLDGFNSN